MARIAECCCLFLLAFVAVLLANSEVTASSSFEDQKNYYVPIPPAPVVHVPIPPPVHVDPPHQSSPPHGNGHGHGHHHPTPSPPIVCDPPHVPTPSRPSTPKPTPSRPSTPKPTPSRPSAPKPTPSRPSAPKPTPSRPSTPKPTPSSPPSGGCYNPPSHSPPPSSGGCYNPPATPTPVTPTPVTPVTPVTPITPVTPTPVVPVPTIPGITPIPPTPTAPAPPFVFDPNHPFGGTCDFWRNHPTFIWGVVGWFGTVNNAMGGSIPSLPGLPSSLNCLQALSNTRTDGYGALYREGTASLLNSLVNSRFHFTTVEVRDHFVASLGSNKAAAAQAKVFKMANEGRLKPRA